MEQKRFSVTVYSSSEGEFDLISTEKLRQLDWRDVFMRAVKTFFQAAVPVLLAALYEMDITEGKDAVRALLVSAAVSSATAGISAVWNMISGYKCLCRNQQQEQTQTSKKRTD